MNSYLPEKQIIVAGYPKSGNTWLARLLGDMLNSPVTGWKQAKPLAEEGLDRPGEYVVRQLHLRPLYEPEVTEFMPSAYRANLPAWNGEKIVHIIRDPRDVAVSVFHYWERPNIADAVRVMLDGEHPLTVHGRWLVFVNQWLAVTDIPVYQVRYRDLLEFPLASLALLAKFFDIDIPSERIRNAVENQSFANRCKEIAGSGDKYNYGETIQLKALRKGIVGDWQNHFTAELAQTAWDAWGEFINQHIDPVWDKEYDATSKRN